MVVGKLPFNDEFRQRMGFGAIGEKIWKGVAHHVLNDEL